MTLLRGTGTTNVGKIVPIRRECSVIVHRLDPHYGPNGARGSTPGACRKPVKSEHLGKLYCWMHAPRVSLGMADDRFWITPDSDQYVAYCSGCRMVHQLCRCKVESTDLPELYVTRVVGG